MSDTIFHGIVRYRNIEFKNLLFMIVRSDDFISNPEVTCSVIVYNQKQWIGQCLDSILNQKCDFDFNIVVSDDCSTDGTQEVLKAYQAKYPQQVKLVLNEQNQGITRNWTASCRAFEGGRYVAFCDGDDYWNRTDKLQIQVDYMKNNPKCIGLTTGCDYVDEFGNVTTSTVEMLGKQRVCTQEMFWTYRNVVIHSCAMLFDKSYFEKYISYDDFDEHFPYQDWPVMVILAAYGEIHYLPISTFAYRKGHTSDTNPIDVKKFEVRMTRIYHMYEYFHEMFPNLKKKDHGEYMQYVYHSLIGVAVKANDYEQAKKYARLSKEWSLRNFCCRNRLTFELFCHIRKCRKK